MLAMVIRDVYSYAERWDFRASLKTLLPTSGNIWSPAGVYCFWDPQSHDALYVGLASNLANRFAEHNGIRRGTGNKSRQVKEWFRSHDRLGYSIVVQSAVSDDKYEGASRRGEGQLIEGHRLRFGSIPPWNQMGASLEGSAKAGVLTGAWFDMLTGRQDSLVVSRRTIRGLNMDWDAEMKESDLLVARVPPLLDNWTEVSDEAIRRALARLNANANYWGMTSGRCAALAAYLDVPAPHPETD
jgi:hypothetical protein